MTDCDNSAKSATTARAILWIQAVAFVSALLLGWLFGRHWWATLAFGEHLFGVALGGVLLSFLSWKIFHFLGHIRALGLGWMIQEVMVPLLSGVTVAEAVLISTCSGFAEEALFRGTLLPVMGLWGSSLLFGLLHGGDRRAWFFMVWATLVGAGLGYYCQSTGDLAGCMVFHATTNFTSLMMLRSYSPPK